MKIIADSEHFQRVTDEGALQSEERLWIANANAYFRFCRRQQN